MRPVAYLTDVEGRWEKLAAFCDENPYVRLEGSSVKVLGDAVFVFGGDAIDRGPHGRKLVTTLSAAKREALLELADEILEVVDLVRQVRGVLPLGVERLLDGGLFLLPLVDQHVEAQLLVRESGEVAR